MKEISIIVAMDRNRLIGVKNGLPWRLPDDLGWFVKHTRGKPVIMGRKTYDSIPPKFRPLAGRLNIVVTRNPSYAAPGAIIVHSPQEALKVLEQLAPNTEETMIGGGSHLFAHFLPQASRIYLTLIDGEFSGDVYFPQVDWLDWRLSFQRRHPIDARHNVAFTWYIFLRQTFTGKNNP